MSWVAAGTMKMTHNCVLLFFFEGFRLFNFEEVAGVHTNHNFCQQFDHWDMSALMMPAATMTTMTNTAPIAVTQPKPDPAKIGLINNNKQGKRKFNEKKVKFFFHFNSWLSVVYKFPILEEIYLLLGSQSNSFPNYLEFIAFSFFKKGGWGGMKQ